MSILTLYRDNSLGIHVVDHDLDRDGPAEKLRFGGEEGEEDEDYMLEDQRPSTLQLVLIYSLQLAEAIVGASLQPQLYILLRQNDLCGSVGSAYWTGLVEAVFALGSVAGLFWGRIGDRYGRRPIALGGMLGLFLSCIAMGFSNGIVMCTIIRAFAGVMSSAIRIAMTTMIGDVSLTSKQKARNFSKLPLVATGGVIGPLLQALLAHRALNNALQDRYPILSSQLACAALMLLVFLVHAIFLKETLPRINTPSDRDEESHVYFRNWRRDSESSDESFNEKDAFLSRAVDISDRPQPITLSEILRAPSLMILFGSYSFLSLHSASFDQLLPLLGNSSTEHGGLGLPCAFIAIVVLLASLSAGTVISLVFSKSVKSLGLLRLYRLCCWAFPIIYIVTPLLSRAVKSSEIGVLVSSGGSIFTKTLVTGFAQTLFLYLVTNASPDSFSLATIMGFMQSATLFRSLAVAGTGVAFSLSSDLSVQATNIGLWSTMAVLSLGGAAIAYFVRDHPTVRDYTNSLRWEVCYDSTEDLLAE